jgi:hypothetical protein
MIVSGNSLMCKLRYPSLGKAYFPTSTPDHFCQTPGFVHMARLMIYGVSSDLVSMSKLRHSQQ